MLGREGRLGDDGFAVDLEDVARVLIHQLTLDDVLFAHDEPAVGDGVDDDRLGVDNRLLVAIHAVFGDCADGRLGELDGLARVVDVGVRGDLLVEAVKRLEDDHALSVEVGGVKREGNVHGAIGVIRSELRLGDDGLAVDLESLARGFEHQLALDRVLLAGHETLVGDRVDDDGLGVGCAVLIAVDAILGDCADGRLGELDGLARVVDVGVRGDLLVEAIKRLEDDHALSCKGAAVEAERHIDGAVGVFGRELRLGDDGLAVDLEGLARGFEHQLALDDVFAAGDEVLVGDGVDDDRLGVDNRLLVAIHAVLGGGADGRFEDAQGLLGVVEILVVADDAPVTGQLFEDDHVFARVFEQIDGYGHLDRAGRPCRGEGLGDGSADRLAGFLVHERCGHHVIPFGGEARELDVIGDDGLVVRRDELVAVGGVVRGGVDVGLRLGSIVDGSEVDDDGVALNDNALEVHELEPVVGGDWKLLDVVSVIWQRAEGVVGRDHSPLLREAEPDAGFGIVIAFVGDGVVGIGLVAVLVPLGGGLRLAVLVGHDDVRLAGGLGGDAERDACEAAHIVLANLDELKIAALHLVFHRSAGTVDDLAMSTNLELVSGPVCKQIAFASGYLLNAVGPVGKKVGGSGRLPVLDDQRRDDVALSVSHAVADDGVVVERLHVEPRAVDARGAERRGEAAL